MGLSFGLLGLLAQLIGAPSGPTDIAAKAPQPVTVSTAGGAMLELSSAPSQWMRHRSWQ